MGGWLRGRCCVTCSQTNTGAPTNSWSQAPNSHSSPPPNSWSQAPNSHSSPPPNTWSSPAPTGCFDDDYMVQQDSQGQVSSCAQGKMLGYCHTDPPQAPPHILPGWLRSRCCATCSQTNTGAPTSTHAPSDDCKDEECCGTGTAWKDGSCVPSYDGVMQACKEKRGDYFFTCGAAASCDHSA